MKQWTDITPAGIDSCYERHKLTWGDAEGVVGALGRNLYQNSTANHKLVASTMALLKEGCDPFKALSSLLTAGYMLGWHVRDEQAAADGVNDLMSDEELVLLREEIDKEAPIRRGQVLLPPIPQERIAE